MLRIALLFVASLQLTSLAVVQAAQQQVKLSDSYLPVAMQVIAHLTDQMAFEVKDEPAKPTVNPSTKPTIKPTIRPSSISTTGWSKPTSSWTKPPVKQTTSRPYVSSSGSDNPGFGSGWWMRYGLLVRQATTPFHKPGLFAPVAPPKPWDRNRIIPKTGFVLLPFDHNTQYIVIEPQETRTDEPLLSIHDEEVKPLIEPAKESSLLPPHFDAMDKSARDSDVADDDNLQYLSQNVRDMIKMANDPDDERLVDVWEGVRAISHEVMPKAKLSSSNLRLLLLYDLLSREAKRQRLSDYSGFSPAVMKTLVDSSSGGARAQLRLALAKMVERRDCEHEYANNRAKEMVLELAKDESKLSSELRYLQPLVYKF